MSEKELEDLIAKTIIATRRACEREKGNVTKATEQRLLAFPILVKKLEDDERRQNTKTATFDSAMENAENRHEVELLETAMSIVSNDHHYNIVQKRFVEGKTIEEIAEEEHCDARTVRRNKTRLVRQMSIYLYGACAMM